MRVRAAAGVTQLTAMFWPASLRCAVAGRVRVAFLAGDGRDRHDPAVALRAQVGNDGAAAEEHARQVDVEDLAPALGRMLPERRGRSRDAGIGHEDVDPTELPRDVGSGGLDGACVRDIDGRRDHLAEPRQLGGGRSQPVRIPIPQRHASPGRQEAFGDRPPETLRAARNDGAPSVQIVMIHAMPVPVCFQLPAFRIPRSAFRVPRSAFRIPHSTFHISAFPVLSSVFLLLTSYFLLSVLFAIAVRQ
jgi:hypothetical protein